ncbi:multidrug transporter AcrB [Caulobacter sp. CCUG 60055]|uniref:efflux RND transporter permease subunit n=1 Tax=Caulobacter sp. CCUG 60055 TaxID=2100090 RepID=UPI001FA70717|nr:efflux RND transporter permease subunit [Caulobacter sp. CCUG 60055]MCI3181198.1 multidrug transporter AcrB [Caulobacter sp. CCUG 60055]
MTLSDLSVRRPVFAAVAAIILCVIGAAAFFALPVRELPNVDPPVVSISTTYTGASAEVVEVRITQIIEQQVAGIQGIDRVYSSSRDGQSRISITFTLDRNLDEAANDVRDAVSRVLSQLPDQALAPQIAKANADSSPLIFLSLTSTTLDRLALADYGNRFLVQRLSTIPGVAQVNLRGAPLYAMRIWLDSDALASRGLTVEDVAAALNSQNVELPAGALESASKDYTIRVNRQYVRPEDFAKLPIARKPAAGTQAVANGVTNPGGVASAYVTRLGDVARVEEGPDERRAMFRSNGQDQIGITLTRQSQANDLEISRNVKKTIEEVNRTLPAGTKLAIAVDYSVFTAEAIHEVWFTMALSLVLVAAVNIIFLGSWRSALIPSIVAPICILATFIVLAPLGFSINLLTLLALVLAIGLVVDDAIVVVENIQRRVDEGEPPLVAAERGARQVFFAVVATTVVLISVFAPLMFLPGYIGRLFVELAVAIAAAVAFSAVLALSLSPMLSSKLLRPASGEGWLARRVNLAMNRLRASYEASLGMMLGARAWTAGIGGGVLLLAAAAAALFLVLPKELVPTEDRGRVDIGIAGPVGAGYDYTRAAAAAAEPVLDKLRRDGTADRYLLGVPGFGAGAFNTGFGSLVLGDWRHRKESAAQVAAQLNKEFSRITGVRVIASVRGPFQRGGGSGSGSNIDLIAEGNDYAELARWMQPMLAAAQGNPGLARPRLDFEPTSPRLLVDIDREKAAALGVPVDAVGSALQTMFGSVRQTTYVKNGQEYYVILQTPLDQRRTVEDLNKLYVRGGAGDLVPLGVVVRTEVRGDTPDRARVDRQRAITLTAELAPGYTVAEAVKFYRDLAAKNPDPGVVIAWGGQAKDYLEASGGVGLAFGLALLLVFLVLAAQFESWIHPGVIMLTVPLAALGGLFGLLMAGSSVNTYSEIGLIILVGIAAKNGILIVEFANQLRDEGRPVREAVIEAAGLRLRPIIMTSIAAAMGALPLILAAGPGAGSRQTIGAVIFSGAIFATLLTLFVVPVFYNLLARFTKSPEWTARRIEAYEHGEGGAESSPAE